MGTGNTGIYVIPDAALIGLLLYYHLTLKADMTAAKLHLSTARLPDSGHPFLHAAPRPCSSSITPTVSGPAEANETGRCDWLGAASARAALPRKLILLIPAVLCGGQRALDLVQLIVTASRIGTARETRPRQSRIWSGPLQETWREKESLYMRMS